MILNVWIILLLYVSWSQWSLKFFFQLKSIMQLSATFTGEGFLFLSTNILNECITMNMMIFELVLILMTRPLIKSVRSVLQLPHPVGTHKRAIQLPTVWPLHPRPGGDDCSHWQPAQEPGGQSERWSWYDSLLQCVIINLVMNAIDWVKAGKHYTTFAQSVLPRFAVWTSWP